MLILHNNLDVKQTFKDMTHTLSKLSKLAGKNRVSSKDAGRIMEVLEKIDGVLQILKS